MSRPFFSVVVTTYNRASLIMRALKSLVDQSENDFEALIIDDGSTDDTKKIVDTLVNHDHRFNYFLQEHAGSTAAKNNGLSLAKGEWLTFLDSDDEYALHHLSLRRNAIETNPNVLFFHGGVKVIGNEYVPDRFNPNKKIHLSECVIGGTFIIKKELLDQLGLFKEMNLGDDAEFFDRIKSSGITFAKIDSPTYIYHRDAPDSMTNEWQESK